MPGPNGASPAPPPGVGRRGLLLLFVLLLSFLPIRPTQSALHHQPVRSQLLRWWLPDGTRPSPASAPTRPGVSVSTLPLNCGSAPVTAPPTTPTTVPQHQPTIPSPVAEITSTVPLVVFPLALGLLALLRHQTPRATRCPVTPTPCWGPRLTAPHRPRLPALRATAEDGDGAEATAARDGGAQPEIPSTASREASAGAAVDIPRVLRDIARGLAVDPAYVAAARREGRLDELGLPLQYDPLLIQAYFEQRPKKLQYRLDQFLQLAVPFFQRVVAIALSGGEDALRQSSGPLARQACEAFEALGPTYIKAGQVLSVRPDLIPPEAMLELARLQNSVPTFSTQSALRSVEVELRQPLAAVFSDISPKPSAAASLAQVYKARTLDGRLVAIKIQRPEALENVSLDLYILRGAARAYQLVAQQVLGKEDAHYVEMFDEFAARFYVELDFGHEAANQRRLRELLQGCGVRGVYVPEVYRSTHRLILSEWIDSVKLSDCGPEDIRALTPVAKECFLVQLLQVGFLHGDPHPGNILKLRDPAKGKLAIVDCGCMVPIEPAERDTMVAAILHAANRNYGALVDDLVALHAVPADCNPLTLEELLRRTLEPYLAGGGLQRYQRGLFEGYLAGSATRVGALQAMLHDLGLALSTLGFPPLPPRLLALTRSLVTLEGIALQGDPNFSILSQAYPFVAQRLLRDNSGATEQLVLDLLYGDDDGAEGPIRTKIERLASFVKAASLEAGDSDEAPTSGDLQGHRPDGTSLAPLLRFVLSPAAERVRGVLEDEVVRGIDLLARQAVRRGVPAFLFRLDSGVPALSTLQALLPTPVVDFLRTARRPFQLLNAAVPALTRTEELYAVALVDLTARVFGRDAAAVASGDWLGDPGTPARLLLGAVATGRLVASDVAGDGDQIAVITTWLQQNLLTTDEARRSRAIAHLSESFLGAQGDGTPRPLDVAGVTERLQGALRQTTDPAELEEQRLVAEALQSLSPEERAVLQAAGQRVVERVVAQWQQRLQPLLPTAVNDSSVAAPAAVSG
eukprot:EG_transcript_1795